MSDAVCVSCGRGSTSPEGWFLSTRGHLCPSCATQRPFRARDQFACAAMQALLTGRVSISPSQIDDAVMQAYQAADAMLKQREQKV